MSEDLPDWYKKKLEIVDKTGFRDTEMAKRWKEIIDKVFDEAKKDKEE